METTLPPETYHTDNMTSMTDVPSTHTKAATILLTYALLMIWIGFGNGLVVWVILKGPQSMKTLNNYLILQLSLADVSVAVSMPYHMALYIKQDMLSSLYHSTIRNAFMILTLGGSLCSLTAMTLDRLISLLSPLHYDSDVTSHRLWLWVLTIWTFPLAASLPIPLLWQYAMTNSITTADNMNVILNSEFMKYFLLPAIYTFLLVIVVLHVPILVIVHRQSNKVLQMNAAPTSSVTIKNRVVIKTGMMVFAGLCITWLPFAIVNTLLELEVLGDPRTIRKQGWVNLFNILAVLNSGINPIIYALKRKDFKEQFKKVMCSCLCCAHKIG